MAKTTLKFFPNYQKKCKKTGKYPIYLRIYHLGKKADKCTNFYLKETEVEHWNLSLQRVNAAKHPVNKFLDKISDKFNDFTGINYFELYKFTAGQIRDYLFNNKLKTEITVLEYINDFINIYIKNSLDLTEGTKKNYKIAQNHFIAFSEINCLKNIPLSRLDATHCHSFHSYLLNTYEKTGKRAMLKVTATGRIKQLRAIINKAVEEGLIQRNPFKTIKNTNKSKPRTKLNLDQIKKIFNENMSDIPVLTTYRDLYIFSMVTGLSYSDVASLNHEKVFEKNGSLFLSIRRLKTQQITEMYLPKVAIMILDKYKNNIECTLKGTLLPYRTNQKINSYLKVIGAKCQINTNLIFHLGRHTYRSIIKEAGIIEPLERKILMGHSTLSDIDAVYHTVTDAHLYDAKIKIDKFIEEQILKP